MSNQTGRLSLSTAALRLGIGYWRARTLLLQHRVVGGMDERTGRYWVDARDLERLAGELGKPRGRVRLSR